MSLHRTDIRASCAPVALALASAGASITSPESRPTCGIVPTLERGELVCSLAIAPPLPTFARAQALENKREQTDAAHKNRRSRLPGSLARAAGVPGGRER